MACDDQATLGACLRSLSFCREIVVVVDASSRDDSEKIAGELATRVVRHPYGGDIEQKRFTTELAREPWLLSVDADEVVTPQLAAAISAAVQQPRASGYEMNRIAFHLGRWVRHGDWHPDWKLRLFRRGAYRWVGENPHGRAEVEGRVERLEGDLLHYSFRDLQDQLDRIDTHTSQAAAALHARGRRPRFGDLALRPPARFLRGYLLKRGFLDGGVGFVVAATVAWSVFLKYAKLRELQRGEGRDSDEHRGLPSG
jgi:hypothetical protein